MVSPIDLNISYVTHIMKCCGLLCGLTLLSACGNEAATDSQLLSQINTVDNIVSEEPPLSDTLTPPPIEPPVEPPVEPSVKDYRLNWSYPTQREDGEGLPLQDIKGYQILYRLTSENDYTTKQINQGDLLYYDFFDLPVGEYEFLIAAFDTADLYSQYNKLILDIM